MTRNNEARKEPTLADLEAFEKLLRESLQGIPQADLPVEAAPAQPAAPPAQAPARPQSHDHNAMAELARLIDTPLDFAARQAEVAQPAPHQELLSPEPQTSFTADDRFDPHHTAGRVTADLQSNWGDGQPVEATFASPAAPAPVEEDPLDAFAAELRRFDAARQADHDVGRQPAAPPHLAEPYQPEPHSVFAPAVGAPLQQRSSERPVSPLSIAESRLAEEAAAAALAAPEARSRSRGVFFALGGLAAAGLAVVVGGFFLGGGKKTTEGGVPVIAAKTEPTKTKPADPGGVEIPNQNKQVLAPRGSVETKPAQVVNTTEQPLDLNQVTKRDGVRVIAPSPYQAQPEGGTAGATEPRRVTSIRIPVPGAEAPPAPPPAASPPAPVPGLPTLATGLPGRPASPTGVAVPTPPARPDPAQPPKADTRPAPAQLPKQEARVEAPKPDPARTETPKVTPPPKVSPPPRTANAPLPLDGGSAAPAAASGGWAVQLASRPSEESAKAAIGELRTKYSAALGGKSLGVVAGEANGNQVYRVRAGGFSQAAAVEACNKVKAAGGGCFVTKQ